MSKAVRLECLGRDLLGNEGNCPTKTARKIWKLPVKQLPFLSPIHWDIFSGQPKQTPTVQMLWWALGVCVSNVLCWKVSLPGAGGLEPDHLQAPFWPKPFCESINACNCWMALWEGVVSGLSVISSEVSSRLFQSNWFRKPLEQPQKDERGSKLTDSWYQWPSPFR